MLVQHFISVFILLTFDLLLTSLCIYIVCVLLILNIAKMGYLKINN